MAKARRRRKTHASDPGGGKRPAAGAVVDGRTSQAGPPARQIVLFGALLIVVAVSVAGVHWPALSSRVMPFDDEEYLNHNPLVQNPGWASAKRFLVEITEPSSVRGYYQPLTMISLMADYALGGRPDDLRQFHRTSLAWHVMNTLSVMVLLYALFGQPWAAALAGLIFGVHPQTVSLIPWVGERKTLLATFFALWCLILYVRFARHGSLKVYGAALAMYVLGLMCKPTVTPIPVLLLLLEYWPGIGGRGSGRTKMVFAGWTKMIFVLLGSRRSGVQRFGVSTKLTPLPAREGLGEGGRGPTFRRFDVFFSKLPFFAIGAVFAVITLVSQKRTLGVTMPGEYPPLGVPLILCHNVFFYLRKFVWPANLSAWYPFPEPLALTHPTVLAGVVFTAVLIAALVISLRWTRALLTGWLFFFCAILPTMGIIGFHPVIAADRHAYFPMVGLLLIGTWLLSRMWNAPLARGRGPGVRGRWSGIADWLFSRDPKGSALGLRIVAVVMVVAVAVAEAKATRRYQAHWQDTERWYRTMLRLTPEVTVLHYGLGRDLQMQERFDEAIEEYRQAVRFRSDLLYDRKLASAAHNNLGGLSAARGELEEAFVHYREAMRLTPGRALVANNLAWLLATHPSARIRNAAEAVELAELACKKTEYRLAKYQYTLAAAYAEAGRFEDALKFVERLIAHATRVGDQEFVRDLERMRRRFEAGRPWRNIH
jgi:hypothetical protein